MSDTSIPAPVDPVPAPIAPQAAAALDAWLGALRDSPIARDTETWNRIYGLVQQIKSTLASVKE